MAAATVKTVDEKIDKALTQLGEFNLRIDDLFRTTSGAIATAGDARPEPAEPSPSFLGGLNPLVLIGGALVIAFLLFKPLRKMIGL
jgi:hypothetical protein